MKTLRSNFLISSTNPANADEQMLVDSVPQPTPSAVAPTQSTNTQAAPQTPSKPNRPPPIFVYSVTNYVTFSKFLKDNQVDNCLRKETNNCLILTTATTDQYRSLHAVLRKEFTEQTNKEALGTLQLHSYQLKCDRAFVVYIRGLPSTMATTEIIDEVSSLQYIPRRVTNVPCKVEGVLVPRPLLRNQILRIQKSIICLAYYKFGLKWNPLNQEMTHLSVEIAYT